MNIIKPVKTMASISALCAVLALSSITSVNASAFDSSKHYQKRGEHMMKRMTKVLSLSEQQQVQIKAIKTQAKEQHELLIESMKKFKGEEKLLLQAQSFDEEAFTTLHNTYQPTFAQMALTRAKTKHAIFNVLTTDQQEKWAKVKNNRKGKHKGKRHNKSS